MLGKRYQKIKKEINSSKVFTLEEAIDFFKKSPHAHFDETIEIHLKLLIDPQKTEQQIRGVVILPYGTVKKKRIAAFVSPAKEAEVKEAGADLVGGVELINKIQETKKCDFEVAVAEPILMKDLARIAKILGPKGLMPNPKVGTVSTEPKKVVEELKKGRIVFKNDEGGNLHQGLAKVSWPKESILGNIKAYLEAVKKARPSGVKSNFIASAYLSTTMGPSLRVKL